MLILAFDTATPAVTVAVHDGSAVIAHESAVDARRHGELLAPSIARVLATAGAQPGDLTALAVGTGPGPYTGLRVGLVTARVLGSALCIPVDGVCTLDIIAAEARHSAAGREFIVATDNGMLHRMKMLMPGKRFIEAPTAGAGAACKSCAHCPWMAMNGLQNLADVLENGGNEIHVDPAIGKLAVGSIDRMLDFAAQQKAKVRPSSDLAQEQKLFSGIGPA